MVNCSFSPYDKLQSLRYLDALVLLLKELAGVNEHPPANVYVCAVGDEDQSIYRFRGAEVHGFGGVLSFGLKGEHDLYNRVVTHLNIFTSAVSLGNTGSLIVFLGEDDERMYLYPQEFHGGFYRVAIGIEDKNDLINDLRQAFQAEGLETVD